MKKGSIFYIRRNYDSSFKCMPQSIRGVIPTVQNTIATTYPDHFSKRKEAGDVTLPICQYQYRSGVHSPASFQERQHFRGCFILRDEGFADACVGDEGQRTTRLPCLLRDIGELAVGIRQSSGMSD